MAKYEYKIDELFGESARGFQPESPPARLWDTLERELDRSSRRKALFRMCIAAGVVLLAGVFGGGYYMGIRPTAGNGTTGQEHAPGQKPGSGVVSGLGQERENRAQEEDDPVPVEDNSTLPPEELQQPLAVALSEPSDVLTQPEWTGDAVEVFSDRGSTLLETAGQQVGEENIIEVRSIDLPKEEVITGSPGEPIKCRGCSPWTVGIKAAPVMAYREVGALDPIPPSGFASTSTMMDTDMPIWGWSAGIWIACQSHYRWQFSSGVRYHQMGQVANAVITGTTFIGSSVYSPGSVETSIGSVELLTGAVPYGAADRQMYESLVEQRFHYLEVPLTATYLIGNGAVKLGFEAGIAGNFLISNKVYARSGEEWLIGRTADIRGFLFSAIGGMDLQVRIGPDLVFTAGPNLRYALQSASETTYFKPYSIGLAAGLGYRL